LLEMSLPLLPLEDGTAASWRPVTSSQPKFLLAPTADAHAVAAALPVLPSRLVRAWTAPGGAGGVSGEEMAELRARMKKMCALRGAAATLGADAVASQAGRLEQQLRTGPAPVAELAALQDALCSLAGALSAEPGLADARSALLTPGPR